jgi:hypothetical protein
MVAEEDRSSSDCGPKTTIVMALGTEPQPAVQRDNVCACICGRSTSCDGSVVSLAVFPSRKIILPILAMGKV